MMGTNVVSIHSKRARRKYVRHRPRDERLAQLLPPLLAVLKALAETDHELLARAPPGTVLSAAELRLGPFSIWDWSGFVRAKSFPVRVLDIHCVTNLLSDKVMSLELSITSQTTRQREYFNGTCDVVSWKRGPWEDELIGLCEAELRSLCDGYQDAPQ